MKKRKEKEQSVEKKQTLAHDEESLNIQEKVASDAINQADELLNDATQKLHVAINEPSMNQQSVKVAATMLDVAKTKRVKAMQLLQKINEKQKVLKAKKWSYWRKQSHPKILQKQRLEPVETVRVVFQERRPKNNFLTIVPLTSAPRLLMVFKCVYTICALPN